MKPLYIFLFLLMNAKTYSQWSTNPAINNAVCNFPSNQMNVQMTSDGAGGAICTWVDTRNGTQDIYAQRINAAGIMQWNVDGISICNAISDQYAPRLVPDGSGGAIITWYDNRSGNYDIYAQRIGADGVVQWTVDGAAITTAAGNQNAQQLVSDGAGGAIIVWSDGSASGSANADINAKHINAAGTILWSVSVCNANSLQNIPQLIGDGSGGAIITWEDWRNFSQSDIYAQHVLSNGFTTWTFNGVPICTEPNFAAQYNTKIVSDGGTGAIICWMDNRSFGSGLNIYAQKVNATGSVQWITDGVAVCSANGLQITPQMIADGSGGAILTWEDRRTGQDIYAQRINGSGVAQWTANGTAICVDASNQTEPQLAGRTSGGAVIIWTDGRNAVQQDIYAQTIDGAGTALYATDGVPVANESHAQFAAQLISDGAGGALVAWQDLRTTNDYDIYSSKFLDPAALPAKLGFFTATLQNKNTLLQWQTLDEQNVAKFNLQRSVDGTSFSTIGSVNSSGNSTLTKNYSYTDYSLSSINSNSIYYRLEIVDLDTKTAYSKIVVVKPAASLFIQISPNPARDNIIVSSSKVIRVVSVVNVNGEILKSISINGFTGQIKIDISELPAGIYFIKAVGENQEWTKQFIKG